MQTEFLRHYRSTRLSDSRFARECQLGMCAHRWGDNFQEFFVFSRAGPTGRSRRVDVERWMAALAHRRGRSGTGAL